MKEKLRRNTKITILVVCIMLTMIGVAYSFIAPLISGVETESTISFNSGMIKITYNGSNVITGENIIPGWSETKEFTVVGSNNTSITDEDIMDYQIKLVVEENTFTDGAIRFELTGSSSNELDTLSPLFGKVPTGTGETLLGTARFNQDDSIKNDVTHTYCLKIGFPNRNSVNQNEDMNKSFKGYVVIEEGKLYIQSFSDYLLALDYEENSLEEDIFSNLRYVGETPNNYITFNDQTWRIIGVFEEGVKIINLKTDQGNWNIEGDSSSSNNWMESYLVNRLNTTYYNNLKDETKELIYKTTWKLGGIPCNNYNFNYNVNEAYNYERGDKVYGNNPAEWTGNIALMYLSDYVYASKNKTCRNNIQSTECADNNWIYKDIGKTYDGFWFINHTSDYSNFVYYASSIGKISHSITFNYDDKPNSYATLYLKSNIQITSGNGSEESPFQIELQS